VDWPIHVSPRAREQIRSLDEPMRFELIEMLDLVASSPAEFLVRSSNPRFENLYAHSYLSSVADGVRMTVYLGGFDDHPRRLDLVAITLVGDDSPA
jgi:hypothetical protein